MPTDATGEALTPFIKDPNAVLDYAVSWAAWLAEVSDTIVTSAWAVLDDVDSTLIIDSDVSNTTVATVWLSGGTLDRKYALRNRISTAGGRIDDRTIYVKIKEK